MRPCRSAACLALALLALFAAALRPAAAETPPFVSPLAPVDTSSPRATMASVANLGRELDAAYVAYRADPTFAGQRALRQVLARNDQLFDLSGTPIALRPEAGTAAFGWLKDILMRMPAIDPDMLPGDGATAPDLVRLPGTEIAIARVAEGPDRGSFRFSADTVARLPEFHARIIALPVLQPTPYESWRDEQIRFAGPLVPGWLVRAIPAPLEAVVLGTPAWKLIAAVVLLAAGFCLVVLWGLFAIRRAAAAHPIPAQAWRLTVPLVAAVVALVLRTYLAQQVNVTGLASQIVQAITLGVIVIAAALAVRSLITLLGELVIAAPGIFEAAYDVHLLRLATRVSGLAAAAAVIVYGANLLGVPLLGLVAGVGVGGLALALAAQSTVENLFGGVSIFADRPFRVGDFIIFAGGAGYVESIGPRSTRIRADDGMEITVPNADLAKMQVTNKTRRDATLFEHVLRFTYDATPERLADFARRMLAVIESYPVDGAAPVPPRVRITSLGDFSIDVQVHAELRARNEDDFYRLQELLLLDAMATAVACGLVFAFPTQTVQVARGAPAP
ncbi:MAG: mechanosensitive ion channel [Amaricoccus sp.]